MREVRDVERGISVEHHAGVVDVCSERIVDGAVEVEKGAGELLGICQCFHALMSFVYVW